MYWKIVNPLLGKLLQEIMDADIFRPFRLVGGTSLSLQIGHRMSVDIDLFTDADYNSIDFKAIDQFFRTNYPYVDTTAAQLIGMGVSYYIGKSEAQAIKIDIYYTENFIRPLIAVDDIRLASIEDIISMKLDVIGRGGRKKDFWDLHALQGNYPIPEMIRFYEERYPYGHSEEEIRVAMQNFQLADDDFDPICFDGKHWELIKLDFTQWLSENYA